MERAFAASRARKASTMGLNVVDIVRFRSVASLEVRPAYYCRIVRQKIAEHLLRSHEIPKKAAKSERSRLVALFGKNIPNDRTHFGEQSNA